MMDKANLSQYLDLIVSNEDVTKPKPDPEMYCRAIAHFGLRPDECLVVEDNEDDIKAAKASGAHLLVVQDVSQTCIGLRAVDTAFPFAPRTASCRPCR